MNAMRRYNMSIGYCHMENRKKPVIYIQKDNHMHQLGTFNSDKDAEDFMRVLDYIFLDNGDVNDVFDSR